MKAIRLILTTLVASIAVLMPTSAAFAYPDGVLDINVDGSVCSNATVPVGVDAGSTPADFVVKFAGQTKSGSDGTSFTTTVKAPTVTETKNITLTATATSNDGSGDQTLNASTVISVRDCSDDGAAPADDGLLPNTGGANLWLLVAGVGLVLLGGGVVVVQRQRA